MRGSLNELQGEGRRERRDFEEYERKQKESEGKNGCWKCGHTDHWAKECPIENTSSTDVTLGGKGRSSIGGENQSSSTSTKTSSKLNAIERKNGRGKAVNNYIFLSLVVEG